MSLNHLQTERPTNQQTRHSIINDPTTPTNDRLIFALEPNEVREDFGSIEPTTEKCQLLYGRKSVALNFSENIKTEVN